MFVNIFWVRVAFVAIPLVAMVGYLAAGGSFEQKPNITIEFGTEAALFAGSEVEIDGEVVGVLQRFGNANRTAFAVEDGKHTIRVLHPDYESRSVTVNSGAGAHSVLLVLDFVDSGRPGDKPAIGFMY